MNLQNIKAFIFDLDGTLIDTEKIYRKVWPKAIATMGKVMTDEQYLAMRSLGKPYNYDTIREWYGEDFDYDEAKRIRKGYFDNYLKEHGMQRKKGAIELLTYLKSKGYITAIATATDMERAMEYIEMTGLTGHFDKVISATMVKEGKPSPMVYEYASRELGLDVSECIAVEDAPNGITSAYRAGMQVVMVPDQSLPDDNIKSMLTACVDNLEEIITLIENI